MSDRGPVQPTALDRTLTIYPTALKVEEVLKARARAGDASLGHRLTTFPELIDALDRDVTDAPPVVPDAVARVLVEDAVAATLGRNQERRAGGGAAFDLVAELKAAGLGSADLGRIARRSETPVVRARVDQVARLMEAYDTLLARAGRADRHDRERRVHDLLEEAVRSGRRPQALVGVERLVVAEIYDYSLLQFLIVRALIRLVGDATLVTLAQPASVDATRFLERTWNRFVEDPAIADTVLPDFVVRGGRRGRLAAVLQGLFVEPKPDAPTADPEDDSLAVVTAPGRAAEVAEACRRVRDLLARGVVPDRIAILARDLAVYRTLIEDAARRYDIPVAFGRGVALGAHGVVRHVMDLLRTIADGLPRDGLVACLRSTYFPAASATFVRTLDAIGYVDGRTRPLVECLALSDARLAHADARVPERARAVAAATLARLRRDGPALGRFVERLAALAAPRTIAAHVQACRDLLAAVELTVPPTPCDAVHRRDGAALSVWLGLLEELAQVGPALDGGQAVPVAAFVARVAEAVSGAAVDPPGVRATSVYVLDILEARGLDFDAVFLLGLDDGTCPAARAEGTLLDDATRRQVNRLAGDLLRARLGAAVTEVPFGLVLRTGTERRAEEPFLFYLALSTAEQRVVLMHPTEDADGKALARSPYLDEVLAITPDVPLESAGDALAPAQCREPGELVRRAMLLAAGGAPALLAAAREFVPATTFADLVRRTQVERRRGRYFLLDRARDGTAKNALADGSVGRIVPSPALGERLRGGDWSASGLDDLAACGFRFFARRVLRLEPIEPSTGAVGILEEGRLVHRLLEELLRRHPGLPDDPEGAAALARSFLRERRVTLTHELGAPDPALLALVWERVEEVVLEVVRDEATTTAATPSAGRRVRLLEWPFRITVADHRALSGTAPVDVTLAGSIDRADLWLDEDGRVMRAELIDYKNAKHQDEYRARLSPERGLGTTALQVPVYALALRHAPEHVWARDASVEAGYLLLRAAHKRLLRPIPAAVLELDPEARRRCGPAGEAPPFASRVVELVAEALDGRFDVDPRDCRRFCAYRRVCRYEPPPPEDE